MGLRNGSLVGGVMGGSTCWLRAFCWGEVIICRYNKNICSSILKVLKKADFFLKKKGERDHIVLLWPL